MELYTDELLSQPWFQRIMKSEGGLNRKEPQSVGGKSCAGIAQGPYEDWLKRKCQIADPPRQVEDLIGTALGTEWEKTSPLEISTEYNVRLDVITAFYKDYFSLARLEVVPEPLKYMHSDFFVNAKFTANMILQEMVGLEGRDVDGILGPVSRELVTIMGQNTDPDDLIMKYHDKKLAHYESIKDTNRELYDGNIRGWRRRAQHVLSELEEYFVDDTPTTSALAGHEDHIDLFTDPEEDVAVEESVEEPTENVVEQPGLELNPALAEFDDAVMLKELYVRQVLSQNKQ